MLSKDPEKADQRYEQQVRWTAQLRKVIYERLAKNRPLSVLETGSGTGAVLRCISHEIPEHIGQLIGVDIDAANAGYSVKHSDARICIGDGRRLPFPNDSFDLVFCHYLLLWVGDPPAVIREMRRVTAPGGICAALAEPCYIEMKAAPEPLYRLAVLQREKLAEQGADIGIGRNLGDFFSRAGFGKYEFGCYKRSGTDRDFLEREIRQIAEDLRMKVPVFDPDGSEEYNVPTYFAFAVK